MKFLNFRDDYLLKRYRSKDKHLLIEIKLETPLDLFDHKDPAPLKSRDIHESVVKHILDALSEFSPKQSVSLAFYFEEGMEDFDPVKSEAAFRQYFSFEAQAVEREVKKQYMMGLKALGIGLTFLFVYVSASHYFKDRLEELFPAYFVEVLHVLGWVSLWPAIFIFLYEISPLRDKRKMLTNIANAELEFKSVSRPELYSVS
jgi:hypothetical protein